MSATLIATGAGLVTAACFGAGDWLTPRSKHKLSSWQINFTVNAVGATLFLIILALSSPHLPTASQTLKIIGASALISIGYAIFVKALTIGAVGIVVPLSSIYPLVTLLLSIIFLSQVFTFVQVLAMGIIVLGAVLLAYEKNRQKIALKDLHKASFLTLGAVLLWGTGFFILNPLVPKLQWQVLLVFLDGTGLVIATILMLFIYKKDAWTKTIPALKNKTTLQAASLLAIGTIALYVGAGRAGSIIIPIVLSSLSPLISSGLGAAVDKESLGILKRLGAVIAVSGVILLNAG